MHTLKNQLHVTLSKAKDGWHAYALLRHVLHTAKPCLSPKTGISMPPHQLHVTLSEAKDLHSNQRTRFFATPGAMPTLAWACVKNSICINLGNLWFRFADARADKKAVRTQITKPP